MAGLGMILSRSTQLYAVIAVGACLLLALLTMLLWLCYRRKRKRTEEGRGARGLGKPPSLKSGGSSMTGGQSMVSEEEEQGGKRSKGDGEESKLQVVVSGWEANSRSSCSEAAGKAGSFFSDASKSRSASRVDLSSNSLMTTEEEEEEEDEEEDEERSLPSVAPSPEVSLSITQQLGWGRRFSLRELEMATALFSESAILGRGGYGVVYHGVLPDGTSIAAKKLVGNRGQAEHEFKVEVEAIGRVRHKNLVCLLGYCIEGAHRILVYEYVDNGTLDQWLHGALAEKQPLPWKQRMQIILGTAKALAYLHEGLEPKVVHRDIKSSNILLDRHWNAKISDFGLAKLLGPENSHVTTRVMGTFGYVAPEYASTGLLNEKSDVYSYGVLLMELITGREPVDYSRPQGEVNLVDWLKAMVGNRQADIVSDPRMEKKPSLRSLKRALLVSLRCVDPDADKRPKMSHVIHMLETVDDNNSFHERTQSSRRMTSPKESFPSSSRRK